ncbi:PAS domain S-box protein [Vulgatibacter sp.]|uniref:PAS domain S-box protein n=1 Tax=Vulgatibacter sp. TaxID=1971226 RepID=UPI0035670D2E
MPEERYPLLLCTERPAVAARVTALVDEGPARLVVADRHELPALVLPGAAILLDVPFGGTIGPGTIATLRCDARCTDVPIIALVDDEEDSVIRDVLGAGANDFLRARYLERDLFNRLAAQRRAWELREELRLREHDLRALVELTRSFAGTLDAGALLHDVTRRLAEALSLRRCSLVLTDARGKLGTVIATSDDEAIAKRPIDLAKYPEIREALRTRRAVVVEDTSRHPLLDPVKDAVSAAGMGAMAVLPLALEEEILGVLFLRASAAETGRSFTLRELDFAAAVANATAVALRNARSVAGIRSRVELVEAEAHARKQYEEIYEHVSDGIALVDVRTGAIRSANPAALAILGLDAAAVRGRQVGDVLLPVEEGVYRSLVERVASGEPVRNLDLEARRRDGSIVHVEVSASQLDEQLVVLSVRDVTERKRFQTELQRTKEFLETLIESSVDGIVAADMQGRIILFNRGAELLLGHDAAAMVGKAHVRALYPDRGASEVMRRLRSEEHGGAGRLSATFFEVLHRSGERIPVQMTAAIIEGPRGPIGSVGIFTDQRDRLRIEGELSATRQKLEAAARQAMIVELAGAAAHELNQPLTSVMGYAELLQRRLAEGDPASRSVAIILREAERMAEVVRKIGKITRHETKEYVGNARIVDLERAGKD